MQSLFLKRFGLAAATYLVVMLLSWLAIYAGELHQPLHVAAIGSVSVLLSQLVVLAMFLSKFNQRFTDASLTELQVVLALCWLAWLLFASMVPEVCFWSCMRRSCCSVYSS